MDEECFFPLATCLFDSGDSALNVGQTAKYIITLHKGSASFITSSRIRGRTVVDIARIVSLTPAHRAENTYIRGSMLGGDLHDLRSQFTQTFHGHPAGGRRVRTGGRLVMDCHWNDHNGPQRANPATRRPSEDRSEPATVVRPPMDHSDGSHPATAGIRAHCPR